MFKSLSANPQNCETHSNNSLTKAKNCLCMFDHYVGFALKGLRPPRKN